MAVKENHLHALKDSFQADGKVQIVWYGISLWLASHILKKIAKYFQNVQNSEIKLNSGLVDPSRLLRLISADLVLE